MTDEIESPDQGSRGSSHRIGWAQGGAKKLKMRTAVVLYVLALIAVVVGVDILFFRNRFWERLMVNVGIVLVFAAFYLRFLKRS
jgi:hypothetical protein